MTFNKKRYGELLEYSQSLKKKGKNLSDICESDFSELLTYSAALYKQLEREYLFNSGGNFVTDNNLNNPEVFPMLKNLTNKETDK